MQRFKDKDLIKKIVCVILVIAAFVFLVFILNKSLSPEVLMSPPASVGDYKKIRQVVEKSIGSEITLKAPSGGEYTSAITFIDFTADGANDAVAFYRLKNDDTSSIYMSVLIKDEDNWIAGDSIKGSGNDIMEFAFGDMDYDSYPELIVGWNMFDSKDNNTLSVYSIAYKNTKTVVKLCESKIYTKMYAGDICGEDRCELLIIRNSSVGSENPADASLYEMENKKLNRISEINLDGSVTSYESVKIQTVKNSKFLLLDGLVDDTAMITEIVTWNASEKALVSPTYNENTGRAYATKRNGYVLSMDINSDGIVEIPFEIDNGTDAINLTSWKQYNGSEFTEVTVGLCDSGMIFNFPDEWIGNVSVKNSGDVWSFYDVSGPNQVLLFKLAMVDISEWNEYRENGYENISINYGTIYGLKSEKTDSSFALNKKSIAECIVAVK